MDHFSIYKLISLAYRTPTDLNILSFLFITVFIIIHMATLQEFVSLQKNEKSVLVLIGFSWSYHILGKFFPRGKLGKRGSGREELPHTWGQGWWPRGTTPPQRSGAPPERSYSTFKVRRGGREKISLVQGKEQWLCFAGAAMKRYPMSKVRETQVRQ